MPALLSKAYSTFPTYAERRAEGIIIQGSCLIQFSFHGGFVLSLDCLSPAASNFFGGTPFYNCSF